MQGTEFDDDTVFVGRLVPLLRASLHGMPTEHAQTTLELWRGHLNQSYANQGPTLTLVCAAKAVAAQVVWRVFSGEPSALLPGSALILSGIATAVLGLVESTQLLTNLVVSAAALFLGSILVRHPRVQPRRPLAVACALASAVMLAYSLSIALDIWRPSDWFIVLGSAVIGVGMALVAVGAALPRLLDVAVGRAYGFGLCAAGAGLIAVAELDGLRYATSVQTGIGKLLAALGTLVMAFTAWQIKDIRQDPPPESEIPRVPAR